MNEAAFAWGGPAFPSPHPCTFQAHCLVATTSTFLFPPLPDPNCLRKESTSITEPLSSPCSEDSFISSWGTHKHQRKAHSKCTFSLFFILFIYFDCAGSSLLRGLFSSCGKQGLLTAGASPAVVCGLLLCGAQALSAKPLIVAVPKL